MELKELREKTIAELHDELIELRQEQLKLRMQKAAGEAAPKPNLHQKVRRNIARVKTIMLQREREL